MMDKIIENTPCTVEEVKRWRKQGTDQELPLMRARYNAKASNLIEELNDIRFTRVTDINDVNDKIDKLVAILLRGIEFKGAY
jgi:hypothetical protein